MNRIEDAYDAFERHEREVERAARKRPKCDECDNTIWDEYYYNMNGRILCPSCVDECRRYTDEWEDREF